MYPDWCWVVSSVLNEFQESSQGSQDSMREGSFVSSTGPDQFSETAIFSCSDSETQGPPTPSQDQLQQSGLSDSDLAPTPPEQPASSEEEVEENPVKDSPPEVCSAAPSEFNPDETVAPPVGEPAAAHQQLSQAGPEFKEAESRLDVHQDVRRSTRTSSESLPVSMFQNISHRWNNGTTRKKMLDN